MAVVKVLKKINLEKGSKHSQAECTYTIVNLDGEKFLQVDTYGSSERQIKGKKSQSIRFSIEAIRQISEIINTEFKP